MSSNTSLTRTVDILMCSGCSDDEDNDSAMNDESADVQQKNDGVKTPPVSIKIPAASAVESATKASNRSP